jgi:hypothetical protein
MAPEIVRQAGHGPGVDWLGLGCACLNFSHHAKLFARNAGLAKLRAAILAGVCPSVIASRPLQRNSSWNFARWSRRTGSLGTVKSHAWFAGFPPWCLMCISRPRQERPVCSCCARGPRRKVFQQTGEEDRALAKSSILAG